MSKIIRKPKPWALQKIFFDVIMLDINGTETSRKAMFLCKSCRHLCKWDEDSDAYRCILCGRKLTTYGAYEIVKRYTEQLEEIKKEVLLKSMKGKKHENRTVPNTESLQQAGAGC